MHPVTSYSLTCPRVRMHYGPRIPARSQRQPKRTPAHQGPTGCPQNSSGGDRARWSDHRGTARRCAAPQSSQRSPSDDRIGLCFRPAGGSPAPGTRREDPCRGHPEPQRRRTAALLRPRSLAGTRRSSPKRALRRFVMGGKMGSVKNSPIQAPIIPGFAKAFSTHGPAHPPVGPVQANQRTMPGGPLMPLNPFLNIIRQRQFWDMR